MNLQEELKALKERIAELEELAKEEQDFPEHCDDYWFLSGGGTIDDSFYTDSHVDNKRLGMGNMFRTRQQAQFALEKLKVEAELRKFSRGYIDGRNNWYILYDFDKDKVMRTNELHHYHQGVIYFSDTYTTREAIESVGEERIKKYIFGVED